jgi:hypothetical protein
MPVHNATASVVALAKSWLMTLDRTRLDTPVPTETLRLWLETIIDLGTPSADHTLGDSAMRTVMGRQTAISEAEKARG